MFQSSLDSRYVRVDKDGVCRLCVARKLVKDLFGMHHVERHSNNLFYSTDVIEFFRLRNPLCEEDMRTVSGKSFYVFIITHKHNAVVRQPDIRPGVRSDG